VLFRVQVVEHAARLNDALLRLIYARGLEIEEVDQTNSHGLVTPIHWRKKSAVAAAPNSA
jgi:hypothetical protein